MFGKLYIQLTISYRVGINDMKKSIFYQLYVNILLKMFFIGDNEDIHIMMIAAFLYYLVYCFIALIKNCWRGVAGNVWYTSKAKLNLLKFIYSVEELSLFTDFSYEHLLQSGDKFHQFQISFSLVDVHTIFPTNSHLAHFVNF